MTKTSQPIKKVLFTTSTLPASDDDPLPAFVKDEAIWFKKLYPELDISVLAPHSAYSKTKSFVKQPYYDEYRFHYFWPFKWEKLTGKGIQPALKKNKLLYLQLPGLFIAEFFATWRLVRKIKPDLIYAHWFTPQALTNALVARITKTRFVFDTQASDTIVLKVVPFSHQIVASVCKQALAYTVPSQQTLDKLLYFTSNDNRKEILKKVTMVPYGTSPVKIDPKIAESASKKYKLKGKRVIYFIGRLVDRKGVDILIKSFAQMSGDDSLKLVIVGDGQMRAELEELASELRVGSSVIFAGFITGEERYGLLELADVCVVPSVNVGDQAEGLPVVFMEGVTAGKALVISDATGAHEIVKNGRDAFVAKAGSVSDLSRQLNLALQVSQSKDRKFYQAVDKLAEQFQWPYIAKKRHDALFPDN